MQHHLEMLFKVGLQKKYKKDEIIFFEGEKPLFFFVLLEGKIRIYKTQETGIQKTLHVFNSVSLIAEMPSFRGIPYPATAICEKESIILRICIQDLKKQLQDSQFSLLLIQSLFEKIRILEQYIQESQEPLSQRVLTFLSNHQEEILSLNQRQIAQRLNTTAESLSRVLKKLKNENKINVVKGKIYLN
ncbi:hypothetical protein CCZ01_02790 [Helicobacter monodelphidis]|uniref:Crp/Fnr family transcriptional regulator n=1 Tax=Helicobacter sp. 15-1451 TaxID=2004995 RepID=UPI000DCD03ED|nr:Crp/Fnr family transcriptional regulator [Helicobacter sp. 15-1451]RAX58360.1 hypothetical protein CCZ01_02790 [Helicobacter sp. 15-1451]